MRRTSSSIRISASPVAIDPLIVGIARLRRQPGATVHTIVAAPFDPDGSLAPTSPGESYVPDGDDVAFDGVLECIPNGVVVRGIVTSRWRGECRRCAKVVGGDLSVALSEPYLETAQPGDDEAYPLDSDLLDLGPALRDAILLELPLAPLCEEDCKGLCGQCGADLNDGPCSCEPPTDPRWARLDVLRTPE